MAEQRDSQKNGGPAFPGPPIEVTSLGSRVPHADGMSLRDWFAGQALSGLIAAPEYDGRNCDEYAGWAYKHADALLAARSKATGAE